MNRRRNDGRRTPRRLHAQLLESRKLLAADMGHQHEVILDHDSAGAFDQVVVAISDGNADLPVVVADLPVELGAHGQRGELSIPLNGIADGIWIENSGTIGALAFGDGGPGTSFQVTMFETGQQGDESELVMEQGLIMPGMVGDEIEHFECEPPIASPLEQAAAELALYDSDADGSASVDEIATAYEVLYGLRSVAASGAADALVSEFDTNGDGALDVNELVVSYHQELAQLELESLDGDGDGFATASEIADSYVEQFGLRPVAAEGAAQGMLVAFDTNQDSALDLEELTAAYTDEMTESPPLDEVPELVSETETPAEEEPTTQPELDSTDADALEEVTSEEEGRGTVGDATEILECEDHEDEDANEDEGQDAADEDEDDADDDAGVGSIGSSPDESAQAHGDSVELLEIADAGELDELAEELIIDDVLSGNGNQNRSLLPLEILYAMGDLTDAGLAQRMEYEMQQILSDFATENVQMVEPSSLDCFHPMDEFFAELGTADDVNDEWERPSNIDLQSLAFPNARFL